MRFKVSTSLAAISFAVTWAQWLDERIHTELNATYSITVLEAEPTLTTVKPKSLSEPKTHQKTIIILREQSSPQTLRMPGVMTLLSKAPPNLARQH